VTVILVVAIASVAAVAMTSHQQLDVRRSANVLNVDQAYSFALATESLALQFLAQDDTPQTDSAQDDWATEGFAMEVEGGMLSGGIEDLQGRLNINNLVVGGQPSPVDVQRFTRLFNILIDDVDPGLVNAIVDWLDPDGDLSLPGGVEEMDYLGLEMPYRPANNAMMSVSELRAVKGITTNIYNSLLPYVTALPEYTKVNINTAPPEVLRAVIQDLTADNAKALITQRDDQPFNNINELLKHDAVRGLPISDSKPNKKIKEEQDSLGVTSNYFRSKSIAQFGRGRVTMFSLLVREQGGRVRVVHRSNGVI
jgi:general secretion pathway protein K